VQNSVSIVISNLGTTEKYFDHFECEMHTDNTGSNRVAVQPATGAWNATNSRFEQNSIIVFINAINGTTYWFRFRVIDKYGNAGAWSTFISEVGGDSTAPSPTYGSLAVSSTAGGIYVKLNPASPASDNDRYELFVRLNSSTTPVATDLPTCTSVDGNFHVGLASTDAANMWARAVDTSGNKQVWVSLGAFNSSGTSIEAGALGIQSDNLVKNGDLTAGNSNWVNLSGATLPSSAFSTGVTGLPRGSSEMKFSIAQGVCSKELIPVDPNKVYLMECWFKIGTPGTGTFYGGFAEYDASGTHLASHITAGSTYGYALFSAITSTTSNAWQYFSAEVTGSAGTPTANQFNSAAKFITAMVLFSDAGTPVLGEMLGFKISEVAAGHARAISAIDSSKIVVAGAIDFTRSYSNKTLDNMGDGASYIRLAGVNGDHTFHSSTPLNNQGNVPTNVFAVGPLSFAAKSPSLANVQFSWSAFTITRGDGSTVSISANTSQPVPSAPTVSQVAGGALAARTLFFRIALVKDNMIMSVSAETSFSKAVNTFFKVTSPASQTGYDGWIPLAGGSTGLCGCIQDQVSGLLVNPIAFGTDYTESTVINGVGDSISNLNTPPSPAGSGTLTTPINLLVAVNTAYFAYPLWDLTSSRLRLAGAIMTAKSATFAQVQSGDGVIALSVGAITFSTPTVGGSSSGSGGGGGGGKGVL
jgi:hypothetical protein